MLEPHDGGATMTFMRQIADDGEDEAAGIDDLAMMRRIDRAGIGLLHQILGLGRGDQPSRLPPESDPVRQYLINEPAVYIPQPGHGGFPLQMSGAVSQSA